MKPFDETFEKMRERLHAEDRARRKKYITSSRRREYRSRSDVKEKDQIYRKEYLKRPEVIARRKVHDRKYDATPKGIKRKLKYEKKRKQMRKQKHII